MEFELDIKLEGTVAYSRVANIWEDLVTFSEERRAGHLVLS